MQNQIQQTSQGPEEKYIRAPQDKALFRFFLIGSIVLFILAPFSSMIFGETKSLSNSIMGMVLGFVIMMCAMLGIIASIIIGMRKTYRTDLPYDERSGKGAQSQLPPELEKWNWGAAGLGYFWGIYFRKWITLLVLIPGFNYIWIIVMGLKGNAWAWSQNRWENVDEFKRAQEQWMPLGIVFLILQVLSIFSVVISIIGIISFLSSGFLNKM